MSKERYNYIVQAYVDMEDALAEAQIRVPPPVIATLIAADLLRQLYNSIDYRGI